MTRNKEALASALPADEATRAAAELLALNRFTKTPLTAEQVYLFSVRLCDNQVDRDDECFDRAALEQLAPLFVGKSGLFDHNWSAREQAARIYRTEVVAEGGAAAHLGEGNCFLKGYAYMLKSEENQALIDEIEAGIKKEVSVSCSVSEVRCSICGHALGDRANCSHQKGRDYEGKRCFGRLCDPVDAYEWSFVAVPAQRSAGVMKALRDRAQADGKAPELSDAALVKQFETLENEAALGRKYLQDLRADTVRLGLLSQKGLSAETLAVICEKLAEGELLEMKRAYEKAAAERLPIQTQLSYQQAAESRKDARGDRAFQI